MDFQAEFDDFIQSLGDHGAAFYKFFDLFKVSLGDSPEEGIHRGLHYAKHSTDTMLSDEQLKALKTYLKAQKSWIRKHQKSADKAECRRRLWFWCQKLIEFGAFDRSTRRDICYWMDTAIERSFEGCEFRIYSDAGKESFIRFFDEKKVPKAE